MNTQLIPFQVQTERVIQLLAKHIYQSPLALLRENAQNAFDAVRLRQALQVTFEACIRIRLEPNRIVISDNGIGMTPDDLVRYYWTAGSSSKNNDAARSAGVVGTFGIGAMANFGIAESLTVETESAITGERTICRAERSKLSLKEDCIERDFLPSAGSPGTTITAQIPAASTINVDHAKNYILEFVSLVDVPVYVNDQLVSKKPLTEAVPLVPETWRLEAAAQRIGERLIADTILILSNNADIWVSLSKINWSGSSVAGRIALRSGQSSIRTFRSGFGLATATVSSAYQFGGVADLLILEPTAGREAISADGVQLLQSMIEEIDAYASIILSGRSECDASVHFMNWVTAHNRYDLCGRMNMIIKPGERISLADVTSRSSQRKMLLYGGTDQGVINMHASDDSPLLILARTNPRRRCEENYLKSFASVSLVADAPVVRDRQGPESMGIAGGALAWRIATILEADYFLRSVVDFGMISHGLPAVAERGPDDVRITLNSENQTVRLIVGLYETEFAAFGSMVKDFVRTVIFPRVAEYVPSSTRQGAEAFLKAIRRPRELFEYADDELGDLPRIWQDYSEGTITVEQAVERSKAAVRSSVQVVDSATRASAVVPDVITNEQALQEAFAGATFGVEAYPAITRLEVTTTAKLLVIDDQEPPLRGYRCFLAITDKVREEMGEFFLQAHRTSVVWGGQKTVFIFLHHSGTFGLYYDLQTREPIEAPTGGGAFLTATIALRDRIFIPIPDQIKASFVPRPGERKRFEVRADILRTETTAR